MLACLHLEADMSSEPVIYMSGIHNGDYNCEHDWHCTMSSQSEDLEEAGEPDTFNIVRRYTTYQYECVHCGAWHTRTEEK